MDTTPTDQSTLEVQTIIVDTGDAVSALPRQLQFITSIQIHDPKGNLITYADLLKPDKSSADIAWARLELQALSEKAAPSIKAGVFNNLGCICILLNDWQLAAKAFDDAKKALSQEAPDYATVRLAIENNASLLENTSRSPSKQETRSRPMPLIFVLLVVIPLVASAFIPILSLPSFLPMAVSLSQLIAIGSLALGTILLAIMLAVNYRKVQPWLLELTVGLVSIVFIGALFSLGVPTLKDRFGPATTPTPTPTPDASVATQFDLVTDLVRSDTSNLAANNEIVVVLISPRTDAAGRVTHESNRYSATLISKPNSQKDAYVVRLARGEKDADLLKFVSALADVSDIYLLPKQ
jgi:hypothetical protein